MDFANDEEEDKRTEKLVKSLSHRFSILDICFNSTLEDGAV